jgi:hypothetical protein
VRSGRDPLPVDVVERTTRCSAWGVGESRIESDDAPLGFPIVNKGVGLDLRFGGSLVEAVQSSLNLSLALTAIRIDDEELDNQYTATSVALLLGYQYL